MSVVSMTGFARAEGAAAGARWTWEIKTVNGKGLDIRLRVAPGYDAIEGPARTAIQAACARGSVSATLTVKRDEQAPTVRVNQTVLDAVIEAMAQAGRRIDAAAPRLDGLFAIRGVLETQEREETDEDRAALASAALAGLDHALADCVTMRRNEGTALARVLFDRLDEIAVLTREAENNPARSPAAIRTRLETQIATLIDTGRGLDPDRLHQEALLIAAKVDIREEIDRLDAHVAASRALLTAGGPIGRKLDFLAQEFNREVNTLCSKSNDVSLTATGIALKTVIEQFREQVQNIE